MDARVDAHACTPATIGTKGHTRAQHKSIEVNSRVQCTLADMGQSMKGYCATQLVSLSGPIAQACVCKLEINFIFY